MGRPSKLTPEITKRLTEAIRAGNYYEAACAYAGIAYSTFREWMVKGEKAKSGKYREFMEAVKKAEHEAEVRMVAMWQKHMPENWQAIATFLERRYPDRWGRKRLDYVKYEVDQLSGGSEGDTAIKDFLKAVKPSEEDIKALFANEVTEDEENTEE